MNRISLLGPPEFRTPDGKVDKFISDKVLALYAYLLVRGGSFARSQLAGLLWGELPGRRALSNLRQALHNLNQLFPEQLEVTRKTVALNPGRPFWLDVTRFERGLQDSEELPTAVALYRGDFLEGLAIPDAPEFESWMRNARERYRLLFIQGLQTLLERQITTQDWEGALASGRRLLQVEPWHEATHRQLMRILARQGAYNTALAQYDRCREVLQRELDIHPMPETVALKERIQRRRNHIRPQLPNPATPMLGRQAELEQLKQQLLADTPAILSIVGPGGIGKTHLATALAHAAQQFFLDGVAFLSLGAVQADAQLAPALLNHLVELQLIPPKPQRLTAAQHLQQALAPLEFLLVLDNFEHLVGKAGWLAELCQAAPELRLVVTSRVRLNLRQEKALVLRGLPYPDPQASSPTAVASYPALALFVQAAKRTHPEFDLSPTVTPLISRICRLVDGLPLALELAAGWVRVQPIANIAADLVSSLDLLEGSLRDLPPRQQSIRVVFRQSWRGLSAAERSALGRLSCFQSRFDQRAAAAVGKSNGRLLNSLLDKSLLRLTEERFELHPLMRQFVQEQLTPAERAAGEQALTDYIVARLESAWPLLMGKERVKTLTSIRQLLDDILLVWQRQVAAARWEAVGQMLPALSYFMKINSRELEWVLLLQTAVEALGQREDPAAEHPLVGRILAWQAWLEDRLGDFEQVERLGKLAVTRCTYHEQKSELMLAQFSLGILAYNRGDYPTARRLAELGLDAAQSLSLTTFAARSHNLLGLIACGEASRTADNQTIPIDQPPHRHKLAEALAYFEQLRDTSQRIESTVLAGTAYHNIAYVDYCLLAYAKAVRGFKQSLARYWQIGNRASAAQSMNWMGLVLAEMGHFEAAETWVALSIQTAMDCRAVTVTLDALSTFGSRIYANTSREADAVAVLCYVRDQPSTDSRIKVRAELYLAQLKEKMAGDQYRAAEQQLKDASLTTVTAPYLANLPPIQPFIERNIFEHPDAIDLM